MNTRLVKQDIYTDKSLTGLSRRCDWFINGEQLINITNTNKPKTIFLTGYRGNKGIRYLSSLLPSITSEFILIIASEDYTFPNGTGDLRWNIYKDSKDIIQKILDSEYLKHIFVENLDTKHEKMSPIPLGLLMPDKINLDLIKFNNIDERTTLCLCRHRTRERTGQWKDRFIADTLCKDKWSGFVKFIDKEISKTDFIKELSNSKFCLCIHGGGYDPCPRFFECILNGTIPIIQHSPLDDIFLRFPVVFIDELDETSLSREFLINKLQELREFYEEDKKKELLELLTLDYWWNIITKKIKSRKCENPACNFTIHSNILNNGGTHCCLACKNYNSHGPFCERNL